MPPAIRIDAPEPAGAEGPMDAPRPAAQRPLPIRFYSQPGIDPGIGLAVRPDGSVTAFAVNLEASAALDLCTRLGDGLALAAASPTLQDGPQGGLRRPSAGPRG